MIGRAAPANPWIFRQIAQYTATGSYTKPTDMDRYRMIRDYFERLMAEVAEHPEIVGPADDDLSKRLKRNHESAQRDAIGRMKQFASWFTHGVPGGATLRREIFESKRGAQVMDKVEAFFTQRAQALEAEPIEEHDAELEAAPASWG
jgi:tRNA-dihydrouridine synthase